MNHYVTPADLETDATTKALKVAVLTLFLAGTQQDIEARLALLESFDREVQEPAVRECIAQFRSAVRHALATRLATGPQSPGPKL